MNDVMQEKRRFYRYPAHQSVELVLGEDQCAGRLANICAGGALVLTDAASHVARKLAGETRLHLKIRLPDHAVRDIPCRVVRGEPGVLALRFESSESALVERLVQPQEAPGAPLEPAKANVDMLSGLLGLYRARLRPLIDRALAEMRQGLEQSRIPSSLKRYVDNLIAHHSSLAQHLNNHVMHQWERWQGQGTSALPEGLALLEDHEVEGWLAVNVSTRKLEQHVAATFERLKTILQSLEGGVSDYNLHPLAPRQLAEGLRVGLMAEGFDLHDLSQVLPFLADPLGFHLKQLYRALIRFVEEARGSDHAAAETSEKSAVADPGVAGTSTSETRPAGLSLEEERRMLHELYSLYVAICGDHRLARQHLYALSGLTPLARGQEDTAARLEDGLVRTAAGQSLGPPYRVAFREWVEQLLNPGGKQARVVLPPEMDERVELYGRVLDALMALSDVIPWLRGELAAKASCFLSDMMQSDDLFSVPDHPLRGWLNALGRLANLPAPPAIQQNRMIGLVNQLNGRWPHDRQVVLDMTRVFDEVSQRQAQSFRKIRERKARTEAARQQRLAGQLAVSEDLRMLLLESPAPVSVIELLYSRGLRQALLVTWLRHHGGEGYRLRVGGLRQLLVALRARARGEPEENLMWWPEFRQFIQEHLNGIEQSQMIAQLQAQLEGTSEVMLRELDAESFEALEAEATEGQTGQDAEELESEPEDPWQRKLSQMQVGDWVIDRSDREQPLYMRLAWRSGDRMYFTVSGSTSLAEQEFDLHTLAERLAAGQLELSRQDKHPLIERVIQQVVQSFYSDIASQTQQDPLTGVLIRHEFEQLLERYHLQATAERVSHHLLLIDIDHFRLLNTTLGHDWGDRVLQRVAQTLRQHLGSRAQIGRLGGDEFGVLLLRCNAAAAVPLAEEIREVLAELAFGEDGRFRVTFSMGLAAVGSQVESAELALRHASLACMQAKENGGDSLRVFKRRQIEWEQQRERLGWLRRLDDGMDRWIQLRAQPIHSLHDKDALPHYEILMAVQDESGHFVSPSNLIEVAERYHRMPDVDRWVFRRVIDWMEQNPEVIEVMHGLSINLSGNTISEPAALDDILNELTRRRVDRSRVCFEITETAAVRDLGAAVNFIREVRQLGCEVSLDDFGTGMSSYAYLQELPVDYVKIDGIFIRNLKDNVKDQALVRSIAEMAQLLGMKTIAEYVEDEHTEEFLRLLGVGYGQGYLYGRPAILNELAGQIMARRELEGE